MNPILHAKFNLPCGLTDRIVRLEGGQWIGASGSVVDLTISSAKLATAEEAQDYEFCRLVTRLVAMVVAQGAPSIAGLIEACGGERDDVLCDVAAELRKEHRFGLSSQVLAYRFKEERRA